MNKTNMHHPFHKYFLVAVAFLLISILLASTSMAQSITIGALAEKNVYGTQLGGTMAFSISKHFAIGAFYQQEFKPAIESEDRTSQLAGLLIDFPIIVEKRLTLAGRLKPSLANERFFVVIPAVETQVKIFDFLQVAGEISYRAGNPAIALKTNLTINNKK